MAASKDRRGRKGRKGRGLKCGLSRKGLGVRTQPLSRVGGAPAARVCRLRGPRPPHNPGAPTPRSGTAQKAVGVHERPKTAAPSVLL